MLGTHASQTLRRRAHVTQHAPQPSLQVYKYDESDAQAPARYPKISNVTLAFLEACCRREPAYEWRVYDVCAEMRQQKERRVQAKLPRPAKVNYHVFESQEG